MIRRFYVLCVVLTMTLVAGCSGSGGNPTMPPNGDPSFSGRNSPTVQNHPTTFLWGYWDVAIDTASQSVEITPIRGAEYTVDVVKFLQPPLGSMSNLSVLISDLSNFMSDGRMTLDVTLRHPFPGLDQFTGFDVYGVFIHKGGREFDHGGTMMKITDGVDSAILENADGYTIWMSPELFPEDGTMFTFTPGALGTSGFPGPDAADMNGFRYFADGLANDERISGFYTDQTNVGWRGKFSPGSANSREYQIKWPMDSGSPVLNFQYAVTANWDVADKTLFGDPTVLDVPEDFPLTANATEPIHINVVDHSTTWYVDETKFGGSIILDLEIFTWHGIESIKDIFISSNDNLVPGDQITLQVSDLDWDPAALNSSVTTVEILNAEPSGTDNQDILIVADVDGPATYDQGFGSPAPDFQLSAYSLHSVNVASTEPSGDLEASATATIEPYFDGFGPLGTLEDPIPTQWWLTLDASASTGTISEYLWEMNGDDLFDDASGEIVSAGFPDVGTHVIKLKITDGMGGEEILELPDSYEVVLGTYVWWASPIDFTNGTREAPWYTILSSLQNSGVDGYILVRGDDDIGGQCVYEDNLTIVDTNEGVRIQGYYGDYDTDVPPNQTGFVRVETDDVTFDGFEVTGDPFSTYMPFGQNSKLGIDGAYSTLFRHLYIHDINPTEGKAIIAWFEGILLVQNVLEIELNSHFQKNQAHEDTVDPGPQIDFLNCTMDRLDTGTGGIGFYASSGGGADFEPTVINCIWTDISDGPATRYIRRQGPFACFADYTCTYDTPALPDGGEYYQGVDEGPNNIQDDPMYVDPYSDHHLQAGSPCEDAGDPVILDVDGSTSDMGCYGGPYGDWDFEN